MPVKGLAEKTAAALRDRLQQEEERATNETAIATAWDSDQRTASLTQPEHVMSYKLYGSVGSVRWKEATPEQAVSIMEALTPVPSGLIKGSFISYIPESARKEREHQSDTFTEGDGYILRLDAGINYPCTVKLEWFAEIGGLLLRPCVELLNIHNVTPRISYEADRYPNGEVIRVRNCSIAWPIKTGWALQTIRYSSGDAKNLNPFLVWAYRETSSPMVAVVKEWALACYQQRQHSRAAYEEDKRTGIEPEPDTDANYDNSRMRSGSRAQHDCLHTEEARKDQALAKRHWLEYIADSDPATWPSKPSEYHKYFDHYAWACHWLFLKGLHVDNGYKYGSSWL